VQVASLSGRSAHRTPVPFDAAQRGTGVSISAGTGPLAGIKINTGPNDFAPIKQMHMERFNGTSWELFGPVMTGEVGG
jgi:hypothetical protein